ncbi:MAG TPA: hypothetical protein VHB98_06495 [Chloroflexota bacterium]|jgi:hypothetical protein|nr:hypothetical protein [Chloroflexota bacterium]
MATERYPDLPPIPEDYEPPRQVTHEQYLRLTEGLPGKYEYHEGLMYPRFYPPGSHVDDLYDGITLDPDPTSGERKST